MLQKADPPSEPGRKADLLDWIVRISDTIRPYSVAAFGIAAASVAIATLLRVVGGWASSDLRFAIYAPAILATGLLAGVPAALAAAIASILITVLAFIPPYFQFKWLTEPEHLNLFFDAVPYLITVYFAYLCRVVLRRLRRGERNSRILAAELAHRSRNLFSVIEVIVQKTLADEPARAEKVFGRLRSVQYANDLLTQKTDPISIRTLPLKEFAPYGENRLVLRGPDLDIGLENIRHLVLLFHELTTNAVKYGALSASEGRVFVEWQWDGSRIALTWKETGGPTVSAPTKEGFGSQLIAICVKALDGTEQSSFMPNGFTCSMSLRLRSSSVTEPRAE
jgi:two-component sensor histidine kinase